MNCTCAHVGLNGKVVGSCFETKHLLSAASNVKVYSFGRNLNGRLGLGDPWDRYAATLLGHDLSTVSASAVSAGDLHSLVLGKEDD